jgi:hypothetical protein
MKSPDEVERMVRQTRLRADQVTDARILEGVSEIAERAASNRHGHRRIILWRKIMKSPLTRTAAVVAIALVVLSFLFPMRHGLVPESVALADVQQAVQAQETVLATGKRTLYFDRKPAFMPPGFEKLFEKNLIAHEDGSYTWTLVSETYVSPQGYANLVYTEDGQLLGHACADSQGVATFMFPPAKMYTRFELSRAYQDAMAGFTIQGFIEMLYQSGDYRRIGPKQMDGVAAVGFEVTDWRQRMPEALNKPIASFLLNMGDVTARAWIDPETKLPIRTEAEGDLAPCVVSLFQEARLVIVDDTFKWGIEIDETMSLPEIPEGYQKIALPGRAAIGVTVSSVALAAMAPWCILLVKRRRRRARKPELQAAS